MIILQDIIKFIGYILRNIEVILCLRRTPYKTHTFKKNTAYYDYYHNVLKFKNKSYEY